MRTLSLITLVVLTAVGTQAAEPAAAVYDIPLLAKIVIDGKAGDWAEGGMRVDLLTPVQGEVRPATDHAASFRLAWNKEGLLLLVVVEDDTWLEHDDEGMLWRYDCIETFLAEEPGAKSMCQWVIAPGMGSKPPFTALRSHLHDYRKDEALKKRPARIRVARTVATGKTPRGTTACVIEALLPWSALDIKPETGREIAFQFYANDADQPHSGTYHVPWYPGTQTAHNSAEMHRLRLSRKASPGVRALASGEHDMERLQTRITVLALADRAGKKASLRAGDRVLAETELTEDGTGRSSARLRTRFKEVSAVTGTLAVYIDGTEAAPIDLPSPGRVAAEAMLQSAPNAEIRVFAGGKLPTMRFARPLWAAELLGPYEIRTTYYDKDYNVVDKAHRPGRYGAVVEVVPEEGQPFRRFKTLFCSPTEPRWRIPVDVSLPEPEALGVPATAARAYAAEISAFAGGAVGHMVGDRTENWYDPSDIAALLAGLYEAGAEGDEGSFYNSPRQRGRRWWLKLKRKLYGLEKKYPDPFVCPNPVKGDPAPVVRRGSLAEAGMKSDARRNIDRVLRKWAADSDEAFAVCIVRHGVIVLHKAYGRRDGKRMTVETRSWMASTTKMLSGTLMMMLVDQGLIDLEDPVGKHIPPLRGLKTNRPLTIRRLYNHTNGMDWHWGDKVNDMEERMAVLLPHLEVGARYAYNGTGMELGCKILELVSGETLPDFYKNHLLDPLGCENTDVASASHDANSVPLDMARIGQMLLNKGAYGNMRFMSEQTFEKMLPRPLSELTGTGHKVIYGVGTSLSTTEGLGEGTFAHGAASSATTRIDPENDMVIVMTRNKAGKNFGKYHQPFIDAIVAAIADR